MLPTMESAPPSAASASRTHPVLGLTPSWSRLLAAAGLSLVAVITALIVVLGWARQTASTPQQAPAASPVPLPLPPLPPRLSATGLYGSGVRAYAPQYPLWSDGAEKRRWIRLPPGTAIDGSDPDRWQFPIGTQVWKEFRFGRPIETRYLERMSDGSWRYASYLWNEAGSDAELVGPLGQQAVAPLAGGLSHDVPSLADCAACHEGRLAAPVLGFTALQLAPDRDPLAPHRESLPEAALDLTRLLAEGLLANYPTDQRDPRIAAPSAEARASAGYLYGNCAHCHNEAGPLGSVGLDLDHPLAAREGYRELLASTQGQSSRFRLPGEATSTRIFGGSPEKSVLWARLSSRHSATQMPPLGTKLVDQEAVALLERWIEQLPPSAHAAQKDPP